MSLKIVCIVQARLNSTRLPRKVLLPILGQPMINHLIERIARAKTITEIAIAVPYQDLEAFVDANPPCQIHNPKVDESDLVGRHLAVAEMCRADIVVRIPSDNVAVDPAYIDKAVAWYLEHPLTFFSNTTDCVNGQWLDGIGAEVFSLSRLKWLDQKLQGIYDKGFREHPHRYFYDHSVTAEIFAPGGDDRATRLDVNDQRDYEFIKGVFSHFGHNRFTSAEVVEHLQRSRSGAAMMYDGPIRVEDA